MLRELVTLCIRLCLQGCPYWSVLCRLYLLCCTSLRTEQITPVLSSCHDAIQASSIYREKQDWSASVLVYAVKLTDSLPNYQSRSRLSKDSCTSIEQVSSSWAPALDRPGTFSPVTVCPIFKKSDYSTVFPLSIRSGQLHLMWVIQLWADSSV